MSERRGSDESGLPHEASSERDELRTIGFRLREIQRLLSMRVEQENRRLESEGIDPVTNTDVHIQHRPDRSATDETDDE